MGTFSSKKVHSSIPSSSSKSSFTVTTMKWQTVIQLLAVLALATARPQGPRKRQAYYFSPSSIYSNPYFGYGYPSYPNPIPYAPPSYQQRVYVMAPGAGLSPNYVGPYGPGPISGEPIPPPPPSTYQAAPPHHAYEPQVPMQQDYSYHERPGPSIQLANGPAGSGGTPFSGGLLLVPIRDETIGGSGGGPTDYLSILTNYFNQWVTSKPQSKPEKPVVGEKPVTETGEKGQAMPEKAGGEAAKPEMAGAEAKPEAPAGSDSEKEQPPRPSTQRFLVISPPQMINSPSPPESASRGGVSTYLILNNQPPQPAFNAPPAFSAPQQRFLNPFSQQAQSPHSVYRTSPIGYPAPIPSANNIQQPTARSAMPDFVLGRSDNKYGFINPIPEGVGSHEDIAIPGPERQAYGYPQFFTQRRAFEDYFPADSVSVESAAKDASNAAPEDPNTTSQPTATSNGTSPSTDEEVVESGDIGPSIAQVKPAAIALAGPGGVAAASPVGTALVGPGGMALAAPSATAVAGPSGGTPAVAPATANAFANPTTYRKQIKNKGPSDSIEYDVLQDQS